jgi:hypothetical protein
MDAIEVVLPERGVRNWHGLLVARLKAAGHTVSVRVLAGRDGRETTLDFILAGEARLLRRKDTALARLGPTPPVSSAPLAISPAAWRIDLADPGQAAPVGDAVQDRPNVLRLLFAGQPTLSAAAASLARGQLPDVTLLSDGRVCDRAAPMAASRAFVSRGLDDVLARAISLVLRFIARGSAASRDALDSGPSVWGAGEQSGLASTYLMSNLPRLIRRMVSRLTHHGDHWRVGYRWVEGDGVAQTGTLAGSSWQVLDDDGRRFYADPFAFEHGGRHYVFVEELEHATNKGVLSVSEMGPDGRLSRPRRVLEEPFHLSYPQVFAEGGDVWMVPESGAGHSVTLYRAEDFPDRWAAHTVLLADRDIFDATLLRHDGLFWLIGTERDGAGNASDMMVVFFAPALTGPWQPHHRNPIVIDRRAARPGGGFQRRGEDWILPVQDGTERYGGGLGLSRLLRLDAQEVVFSDPVPIDTGSDHDFPYPKIHTLNRHGRLEVIDGLAHVRKPRRQDGRRASLRRT